jgi:hypothetical protein
VSSYRPGPTSEAESAANRKRINWKLLGSFYTKAHPNQNHKHTRCCPNEGLGVGEVLQEALAAQHLLDLVGIPLGRYDDRDIDARTWLAVEVINDLRERLARIETWHARESEPGGMVGDFCTECGERWPCDTRRMAEGTYKDDAEPREAQTTMPSQARYPFPGDSPVVRARRIANAYRHDLQAADPDACARRDAQIVGWGERWAVPEAVIYKDDDWITAAQAADLASVAADTIGQLRRRGRLKGRPRTDGKGYEYQARDIYNLNWGRSRQSATPTDSINANDTRAPTSRPAPP